MKDTVIKGDGTSRTLKAPTSMPETFEEWRSQLLAGNATMDIGLNSGGCTVVGTALSKANLLSDTTKAALKLSQSDPTINDALYALSQKVSPAEIRVMGDVGTTVTMTREGKTLSGTVDSTGYATLYTSEMGDWTITFTYDGIQKVKVFTLEVIGIITVYPFVVGNSLEETSWSELSIMSKFGVGDKYFKVGDTKNITVNGVNYPVQIIGFNHDTLTSGGTAGMTFQLVNCLNDKYPMETSDTNENGWEGCLMRQTTLNTIYGQLNSDLTSVIKNVNKVTSIGYGSSNLEITSDKLFLLSEIEVFGYSPRSYPGEGKQYEYYAAGNSPSKTVSGSRWSYWDRSPSTGINNEDFCIVGSTTESSVSTASSNHGVSFCFCI